jgi:hypothetical protein
MSDLDGHGIGTGNVAEGALGGIQLPIAGEIGFGERGQRRQGQYGKNCEGFFGHEMSSSSWGQYIASLQAMLSSL